MKYNCTIVLKDDDLRKCIATILAALVAEAWAAVAYSGMLYLRLFTEAVACFKILKVSIIGVSLASE